MQVTLVSIIMSKLETQQYIDIYIYISPYRDTLGIDAVSINI